MDAAALAEDVEKNLFSLLRTSARLPRAVLEETAACSRLSSFPDNGYYNCVFRPRDDLDLDAQIGWFADRRVPAFYVWTRQEPSALGERMRARGFAPYFDNSPGMAAPIAALTAPPATDVLTLEDDTRYADFAEVFDAAFDAPPSVSAQWLAAARAYPPGGRPWTMHLAYLDGAPAAISMGHAAGGVLGLYCIGTHPRARGRGLGAAVTFAAVAAGRDAACDRAVLFASPEGEPLYARMGFRRVPIMLSRHKWSFA